MIYLKKFVLTGAGVVLSGFALTPHALTLPLPSTGDVIGEYQSYTVQRKDSWLSIAQKFDVGLDEIRSANLHVKKRGLAPGTKLNIPTQFALPKDSPREGIVLDLNQKRIFYFHPTGDKVSTYPVGVGQKGWSTPTGQTAIIHKERNPAWRPTPSIRREALRKGRKLAAVYPPGPRNPLGKYAMRLGLPSILIHGTNQPHSIGQRCSHGCIRMFAKDIKELFETAPIGTTVNIVQ